MVRHTINVGRYQYVADYYDANIDLGNEVTYSNYVMLRNFKIMNDIACDTEIYIIEKNTYEKYKADIIENGFSKSLVFPYVAGYSSDTYSISSTAFNNSIDNDSIINDYDVYKIFEYDKENLKNIGNIDKDLHYKNVKNNVIKLYHPHIKKTLKGLIVLENFINNIHFYYLCSKYEDYSTHSEEEFRINNNIYSEYIKIYFPNIMELFGEESTCGYIENLDTFISRQNDEFINEINIMVEKEKNYEKYYHNDVQFVPLNLLTHPYRIIKEIDSYTETENFVKLFINVDRNISTNYLSYPVTLLILPYDKIDDNSNLYILNTNYRVSSETFLTELEFTLTSKLGFNDNNISILNTFDYPYKAYFTELAEKEIEKDIEDHKNEKNYIPQNVTAKALQLAYKYYHVINESDYDNLENSYGNMQKQIDDINKLTYLTPYQRQLMQKILPKEEWATIRISDRLMLDKFKEININTLLEEFQDREDVNVNFFGFKITLYSDALLKNKILVQTINISKFSDLDNFSFNLTNIFSSWTQMPEHLLARVDFIDNLLGLTLNSNIVVITKDFFKYMIRYNSYVGQLKDLTEKNKNMKTIYVSTPTGISAPDINNSPVNFINTINCIVKKESDGNIPINTNTTYKPTIIYKPIFYRVQELDNIKLEQSLTQNIGINLVKYMTKYNTFKLLLGENTYIESSRSSIYVIFKIDTSLFTESYGRYHILGDDDTYISSGSWRIV